MSPRWLAFLFLTLGLGIPLSNALGASEDPEKIRLQLKWRHQFQFAGYYVAAERGFYREAGLEVELVEGRPGLDFVQEVVDGSADYGIEMDDLLLARANGAPVVALAAIYQHSPIALFSLSSSNIAHPHDLIGKSVMLRPASDADLRAMLLQEGIALGQVRIVDHSFRLEDLLEGRIDAMSLYSTAYAEALKSRGVDFSMIRPVDYGIDFYGDCLFTTEREIADHPQRVDRFLNASLKGWRYAFEHIEETARLIHEKYAPDRSVETLIGEGRNMEEFILPKLVQLGHMNPGRWEQIRKTYVSLGMLEPDANLEGFLHQPDTRSHSYQNLLPWATGLFLLAILVIGAEAIYARRLRTAVQRRTNELRHSEEKFKSIIESAQDAVVVVDREGSIVESNDAFAARFGKKREAVIGKAFWDLIPSGFEDIVDSRKKTFERVLESGAPQRLEDERDGRWFDNVVSPLVDAEGNVSMVSIIIREITEIKRHEEESVRKESLLRLTLDSSEKVIFLINVNGKILMANRLAEKETGLSTDRLIGANLFDFERRKTASVRVKRVREAVRSGTPFVYFDKRGGRLFENRMHPLLDPDGKTELVALFSKDITEQKRMEVENVKIQKLESLGVLAGGLAHDFNNILTMVWGNIQLADMNLQASGDRETQKLLEDAGAACQRARGLTRQLLTFAKGGQPVKRFIRLEPLIEQCASFSMSGSNVRVETRIAQECWPLEADEAQIAQVLQNLLINADQAMPEGGTIALEAENLKLETPPHEWPIPPGHYVKISVSDQGQGIDEGRLGKIFDPYFTTKSTGSGLGLASSFSIVRNHRGHITVESKLGVGSRFMVILPAIPGHDVDGAKIRTLPQKGRGSILLMDDEQTLRSFAKRLLTKLGYQVTEAADGQQAIDAYRRAMEEGAPFDAAILDMTIPGGMGGKACIQRLKELDPNVTAIVSSGYSDDPVMSHSEEYGFAACLEKPYLIERLSEVLAEALGSRQPE